MWARKSALQLGGPRKNCSARPPPRFSPLLHTAHTDSVPLTHPCTPGALQALNRRSGPPCPPSLAAPCACCHGQRVHRRRRCGPCCPAGRSLALRGGCGPQTSPPRPPTVPRRLPSLRLLAGGRQELSPGAAWAAPPVAEAGAAAPRVLEVVGWGPGLKAACDKPRAPLAWRGMLMSAARRSSRLFRLLRICRPRTVAPRYRNLQERLLALRQPDTLASQPLENLSCPPASAVEQPLQVADTLPPRHPRYHCRKKRTLSSPCLQPLLPYCNTEVPHLRLPHDVPLRGAQGHAAALLPAGVQVVGHLAGWSWQGWGFPWSAPAPAFAPPPTPRRPLAYRPSPIHPSP